MKQASPLPVSLKTRAKNVKIKLFASLIAAWNIWFACKVVFDGKDVYSVISARLGVALTSSQHFLLSTLSLLRLCALTGLAWMDVILPFVQDVLTLVREYIYPFISRRVIGPVSHIFAPVPGFLLHQSLKAYRWINDNVPLEYKLVFIVLAFLATNRRIDKFLKLFVFAFLTTVFSHAWFARMYASVYVQVFVFAVIPSALAVDTILRSSRPPTRAGNLLVYSIVAPVLWIAISYVPLSASSTLIAHCSTYGFTVPFLYMINQPNLLDLFTRFDRAFAPLRQLFLGIVVPASTKAWNKLNDRFPQIAGVWLKASSLTPENAQSRIVSILWGNKSVFGRIFDMIKSAPLIVIGGVATLGLLAGIYYTYSSASRFAYYAVFPWWISESTRVIAYKRTEDFKVQLAFSLLFIGIEALICFNSFGLISFILNLVHIPLILLFRLMPVQVVKLVSRTTFFVPELVVGILSKKHKSALPPPADPIADVNESDKPLAEKKGN